MPALTPEQCATLAAPVRVDPVAVLVSFMGEHLFTADEATDRLAIAFAARELRTVADALYIARLTSEPHIEARTFRAAVMHEALTRLGLTSIAALTLEAMEAL